MGGRSVRRSGIWMMGKGLAERERKKSKFVESSIEGQCIKRLR